MKGVRAARFPPWISYLSVTILQVVHKYAHLRGQKKAQVDMVASFFFFLQAWPMLMACFHTVRQKLVG